MRNILIFVLVYVIFALALTEALGGNLRTILTEAAFSLAIMTETLYGFGIGFLPVLPVIVMIFGGRSVLARSKPILAAMLVSLLLPVGFVFMKMAIPRMVPFYADPMLAAFGHWLHFGHDPWEIAHRLLGETHSGWMSFLYVDVWWAIAFLFPVIIVAIDRDAARVQRYLRLFVGSWVVIGNLLATLGSSVGPVFYDRLLNSTRFAQLDVALQNSGIAHSRIGEIQADLWQGYSGALGGLWFNFGISAFPSMHIAIATIVALYLAERSRWLIPVGIAFIGLIFIVSVYSGYHYAIDGYVSLLVVWLGHRYLRPRAKAPRGARMLRGIAASQLLRSVR